MKKKTVYVGIYLQACLPEHGETVTRRINKRELIRTNIFVTTPTKKYFLDAVRVIERRPNDNTGAWNERVENVIGMTGKRITFVVGNLKFRGTVVGEVNVGGPDFMKIKVRRNVHIHVWISRGRCCSLELARNIRAKR